MIKNNLLTKILIVLGLAFSVSTFVSADRTANGVPGDGVIGRVLVSLGGGDSVWTATSSLGISSTVYTGTYPIIVTGSVISTGFSTSTINVFSAKQTFTNASSTSFTGDTLYSTTGIFGSGTFSSTLGVTGKTTLGLASTTAISTGNLNATGTVSLATTTINGDLTMGGAIIPRVVAYTGSTTITINTNTTDIATTTVRDATSTFAVPSGTLFDGKMFEIWVKATTTRGLAWSTSTNGFASSTDLALPITVASGTSKFIFEYRNEAGMWELNGYVGGFIK